MSAPATPSPRPPLPPAAFIATGLASVAVTALILIMVYTPVISLFFAPAPPAVEPLSDAKIKVREREFHDRLATAADKVIKRSPFHPPVEPVEAAPRVPAFYGGPAIVGVAGGSVYFADSSGSTKRIPAGATVDGIEVIKIDAPWSVTLGWSGGKYDVPMLERKPVSFDQSPMIKDTLFQTTPAANEPRKN